MIACCFCCARVVSFCSAHASFTSNGVVDTNIFRFRVSSKICRRWHVPYHRSYAATSFWLGELVDSPFCCQFRKFDLNRAAEIIRSFKVSYELLDMRINPCCAQTDINFRSIQIRLRLSSACTLISKELLSVQPSVQLSFYYTHRLSASPKWVIRAIGSLKSHLAARF